MYQEIGRSYAATRREDDRITAQIATALGDAATVVNVGAGTGNYEPRDRPVVAVEPSAAMVAQRPDHRSVLVVDAFAEALPFAGGSFDAAMAVLTVHHWADQAAGLAELRRVARRQVVFFFETSIAHRFWALEYFPGATALPSELAAPGAADLRSLLDVREIQTVPVPRDCLDGFGSAFWCRPEAYLDPLVQGGMSWIAQLPADVRAQGSARLAEDLASGDWERRHGHLRRRGTYDGGYRLAVAGD